MKVVCQVDKDLIIKEDTVEIYSDTELSPTTFKHIIKGVQDYIECNRYTSTYEIRFHSYTEYTFRVSIKHCMEKGVFSRMYVAKQEVDPDYIDIIIDIDRRLTDLENPDCGDWIPTPNYFKGEPSIYNPSW